MSESQAAVVFVESTVSLHASAGSWKRSHPPPVTAQGFIFFVGERKMQIQILSLGIFCAVFAAVFLSLMCLDSVIYQIQ